MSGAGYRERWLVKPGLSGLAQVRGEYHTTPAYKLKYDLAYIHNHTLLLDFHVPVERQWRGQSHDAHAEKDENFLHGRVPAVHVYIKQTSEVLRTPEVSPPQEPASAWV